PLLLLGTLAGRPQHAGTVILVAVQTISSITIQSAYQADFQLFADIALSTALGVVFALVWARLTRPFGTLWAARRLVRHGWQNLAQLADLSRGANTVASASAFVDRIAQLLPRLTQLGDQGLALNDVTRELRVCFRLLELRELRPSGLLRRQLTPVLTMIQTYFRDCATAQRELPPPAALRHALESTVVCLQQEARQAAQALHGLRLALFPDAPASVPCRPSAGPADAGAFA
ncbi:MAG TPA: FUSC family protein, partial [Pseudomonas sp.]|nr:FUSC family protein [Pseudomonas sp.]